MPHVSLDSLEALRDYYRAGIIGRFHADCATLVSSLKELMSEVETMDPHRDAEVLRVIRNRMQGLATDLIGQADVVGTRLSG